MMPNQPQTKLLANHPLQWDDEYLQNWLNAFAAKSLWRLPGLEACDLINELYIVYHRIVSRYQVANVEHAMSLFMVSASRHVTRMADIANRQPQTLSIEEHRHKEDAIDIEPVAKENLMDALTDAPDDIRETLAMLVESPAVLEMQTATTGRRYTFNERLARELRRQGVSVKANAPIADDLKRHLRG